MTRKRHNKQKKYSVVSDSSDDNTVDGSTTHSTAMGRTHLGCVFMGAIGTQKSLSTSYQAPVKAPVNQSPVNQSKVTQTPFTGQPVTGQAVIRQNSTGQPGTGQPVSQPVISQPGTGHVIPGIRHRSPVTGQPVIRQNSTGQPGTGQTVSQPVTSQPGTGRLIPVIRHRSPIISHWSLESDYQTPDTSHQAPGILSPGTSQRSSSLKQFFTRSWQHIIYGC